MNTETALPIAQEATASGQQTDADLLASNAATEGQTEASEGEQKEKPKAEKTEAERELERLRRGIDRKTRQREEARAEAAQLRSEIDRLRTIKERATIDDTSNADEPLTLSRAELARMVKEQAEQLAPNLRQQTAEIEHRKTVISSLSKDLGQEAFDALAEDLDEALGGLQRDGKATPATDAIFAADDPKAVMKYLADPDNADEAEALGRMDPVRAGRAVARLEAKLEQAAKEGKPQRSKAPEPVEPGKGGGVISNMPDPSNTKAYIKWANEQERLAR